MRFLPRSKGDGKRKHNIKRCARTPYVLAFDSFLLVFLVLSCWYLLSLRFYSFFLFFIARNQGEIDANIVPDSTANEGESILPVGPEDKPVEIVYQGDLYIRRIDIANVDKLIYAKNTTTDGITTIEMNFAGDGSAFIRYRRTGEMLEMRFERATYRHDPKTGVVTISAYEAIPPTGLRSGEVAS